MKTKLKTIIVAGSLIALVLLGVSLRKSEAAVTATFALSPASGSYEVGQTFNINVNLNTGGNDTDGAAVRCVRYDTSLLSVQSVTVGNLYSNTQTNTTSSSVCGQIEVSQVNTGGATYNGSGTFVTINFKVLAAGTANVTIDHTLGITTDSNVVGLEGDILSSVTNASFTLTAPVSDTTPPVISGVKVGTKDQSAAIIEWITDEASTSQVEYGTAVNYGSSTTLNSSKVTNHQVSIGGLSAGVTYNYRVKSQDASGNLAVSSNNTFTTDSLPPADTTPPTISNVRVVAKDASAAVIAWDTNEVSTSQVEYGVSSGYGSSTTLDSNRVLQHQVSIGGLNASTTYYYRVVSKDAANNEAKSGGLTFITESAGATPIPEPTPTADTIAPMIVKNLTVSDTGDTFVILSWTASGDDGLSGTADSYDVRYSTVNITSKNWSKSNKVDDVAKPSASGIKEKLLIQGLKPKTKYYFSVKVSDEVPNVSDLSNVVSATTKEAGVVDTVAPAKVENFSAVAEVAKNGIVLDWANPLDDDFIKVVMVRKEGSEPLDQNDGIKIYEGTATTYTDTSAVPGVTYHYKVFALDEVPNYSAGVATSAVIKKVTVIDALPPKPVSNLKTKVKGSGIVISWVNPLDSDLAEIIVRRSEESNPRNQDEGQLIYQGLAQTFTDTNIEARKTYYYAVFAVDSSSNYSKAISAVAVAGSSEMSLTLGVVIALLLAAGGFGYWWFFYRGKRGTDKLEGDDQNIGSTDL